MAKQTQRERLETAEAALGQLEEELGVPFLSLRTATAIKVYFAARRGYDPATPGTDEKDLAAAARRCCGLIGDADRQMELAQDGVSPARQLITTARDLADAYDALVQEIGVKGATLSVYGTWENAVRELMVHPDLMHYVERLRNKFPGPGDVLTALNLFHYERRGGEIWAVGPGEHAENAERV